MSSILVIVEDGLATNYSDLPEPIHSGPDETFGGFTARWRFENGFGASVINHEFSYGTELAVLRFDEDGDWSLVYDTPITDDVIGHIGSPEELVELLRAIQALPKN